LYSKESTTPKAVRADDGELMLHPLYPISHSNSSLLSFISSNYHTLIIIPVGIPDYKNLLSNLSASVPPARSNPCTPNTTQPEPYLDILTNAGTSLSSKLGVSTSKKASGPPGKKKHSSKDEISGGWRDNEETVVVIPDLTHTGIRTSLTDMSGGNIGRHMKVRRGGFSDHQFIHLLHFPVARHKF
jgi:hypothetical protein